jgi:hypothetical protein
MIGIGIGIPFRRMGAGIDPQAQAHYDRVIADGGLIPSGLNGVNNFFTTVKGIYGTSDITTAISVGLDAQVLGYNLGSGVGTTAGQAAQKLYSCSGASGDVEQTVASSQPLLLVHSGANYWWGSGVAGNYLSTPNAAANQITGDIEIVSKIDYKNNATLQTIVDKSNGTAFNYSLYIDGSNVPKFIYSVLGVVETAICSSNIGASFNGYIKATRTFVNGVFKFFTSSDGITYTQLGTDISGTIGLLDSNSHPVTIGILQPSSFPFQGKIYRATISNSIGGAPVVDFNPSQYNAATSQTQWTSTTGEVWTINTGTATGGYKGLIVDKTYIQNDGVDDFLIATTSGSGIKSQYFTHKVLSGSGGVPFGLWTGSAFSQSFYYPSGSQYGFYQSGPQDGPFGVNVFGTKKLRVSGAVGGTGTNWIPFQDGVDVSNGGANIGSSTSYTSIRIGVRGNDTGYDNGIVGNYIISGQADTAPQRTAMQALLKTISNL